MSHLSDERFLQLGAGRSLTRVEDAHVLQCVACGNRLSEERELSALLFQLEPSAGTASCGEFIAATLQRFERAQNESRFLRPTLLAAVATLAGGLASLFCVVAVADRTTQVLAAAVEIGVATLKAAQVSRLVVLYAPGFALLVACAFVASAVLWANLLVRVLRNEWHLAAAAK